MNNESQTDRFGPLLALASLVLLWRAAAAVSPYREGALASMTGDTLAARWSLGVMGVVFTACGLYAYARARRPEVALFALYACAGGLHWGGPIAVAGVRLEAALLLLYFVAGDLLGRALFLHFTLRFAAFPRLVEGRRPYALYLPAALGSIVGLGLLVLPFESAASRSLRQAFLVLISLMIVYDLLALAALVIRAARPRPGGPSRRELAPILGAFAIAGVITFLPGIGRALPGGGDLLNLGNVLIPLALAHVIVKGRVRP